MKIKNIYKVAFLALSVFVISCKKDNDVYIEFSDAVSKASGNKTIERGTFTSFADLSKGVAKRTWTIPESSEVINGNNPSEMELIHVRFNQPGNFDVRLQSEFKNPEVSLDTTFSVSVLDYVKAAIDVKEILSDYIEETEDQITIYENGTIRFEDVSTGRPNRRLWTFDGGNPLEAGGINLEEDELVKEIAVNYKNIGTYDVTLTAWRQFPDGDPSTITLKDFVNVIENREPPVIQSVVELKSGVIQLTYDFPLQHTADLAANFTITVNDVALPVTAASVSLDDAKIVEISPAAPITKGAVAKLAYDGESDLRKENDVLVEAFTDQLITNYTPPNIADDYIFGFEDGGTGWTLDRPNWPNKGDISFVTDIVASGNYAMRMESVDGTQCLANSANKVKEDLPNFVLEGGKSYTVEFKIWIDESFEGNDITPRFRNHQSWVTTGFWTSLNGVERGKWVTINKESSKVITPTETGTYFLAFLFNNKGVCYIDDVKVYEVE